MKLEVEPPEKNPELKRAPFEFIDLHLLDHRESKTTLCSR